MHSKYKYFDSTVQRAGDRRQKVHFCLLPFAVNVMHNLSIRDTWNIRIEYGGIRSVHNRSWIFVKVYHTSVVLLEYDGAPFLKIIL